MTLMTPVEYIAYAYVSWGLWVATCPRPQCPGAEHCGPHPLSGYVGGLRDTAFRCGHCTLECPAAWPADRDVIDQLLGMRPVPATRNWSPGEPVEHLVAENIQHGLLSVGGPQ